MRAHLHLLTLAASSGSPSRAMCRATSSSSCKTLEYDQSSSAGVRDLFIASLFALSGERMTREASLRRVPIAAAQVDRVVRSPEAVRPRSFNNRNGDCMTYSIEPAYRRPPDTSGNHQRFDAHGFDLQMLSAGQLAAYSHGKAFGEAIRHDPRTDQQIARHARISKGHLSKLRSGLWEEQANRLHALLMEVGHVGPAQKLLYDLGFDVKRRKPRKKGGAQ